MKFSDIEKAQKILVYGFGVEGRSTLQFLRARFPGKDLHVFDDNLALNMPDFKKYPIEDYDILITSPGIDRRRFSHDIRAKITSQVEIFFNNIPEEKRKHVIGISGTKGKSTTTKFCYELLKKAEKKVAVAGNYGVPMLDVFSDFLSGKYTFIVAELSSYQLEFMRVSPGIAIFLNVFPEHLDRHGGYENYIEAKKNLWRFQEIQDVVICPQKIKPLIQNEKSNSIFESEPMPTEFFSKNSIFRAPHFLQNFGTMIVLAQILNISENTVKKTAHMFKGLPHRLEFIEKRQGIFFYNDSISTNPHSTYSALQFLKDKVGTLIVGGKDRGVDYTLLYSAIEKFCPHTKVLVLDTETKEKLVSVFQKNSFKNYIVVKNIPEAVKISFEETPKHKVCLLSPAASSFDTFKNYIERGNLFKKSILERRE